MGSTPEPVPTTSAPTRTHSWRERRLSSSTGTATTTTSPASSPGTRPTPTTRFPIRSTSPAGPPSSPQIHGRGWTRSVPPNSSRSRRRPGGTAVSRIPSQTPIRKSLSTSRIGCAERPPSRREPRSRGGFTKRRLVHHETHDVREWGTDREITYADPADSPRRPAPRRRSLRGRNPRGCRVRQFQLGEAYGRWRVGDLVTARARPADRESRRRLEWHRHLPEHQRQSDRRSNHCDRRPATWGNQCRRPLYQSDPLAPGADDPARRHRHA